MITESSGDIRYNRHVNGRPGVGQGVGANDLISSPLISSLNFGAFATSNPNNTHLRLHAMIGSGNYHTDFYFNDNSTSGLDKGYDAAVYGNNAPSKALYSQLVQNNLGVDMAIQSLAYDALLSDIMIPVGINVPQGQQVTVSIAISNLPNTINIYLEDMVSGMITLLNASEYTFTADSSLNDTGRFFL